jgi:2'-5' RNA ligase
MTSAVLIALPELDDYTRPWRSMSFAPDYPHLPLSGRVPPHITVLVPWVDKPDADALERLGEAIRGFGPFELTFPTADLFDDGTVYLRPEPWDALHDLIFAVMAAFPDHPPYGGEHPDPHPHLTVAADGDAALLEEVRAVAPPPPVRVEAVTVWESPDTGVWHQTHRVPFVPHGAG